MRSRHEENVLKKMLIALAVIPLAAPDQPRFAAAYSLSYAFQSFVLR